MKIPVTVYGQIEVCDDQEYGYVTIQLHPSALNNLRATDDKAWGLWPEESKKLRKALKRAEKLANRVENA